MPDLVKIVVTVPSENADSLRRAIGEAGAGKIDDYSFTSFSVSGTGRFVPGENAKPTIGDTGVFESVSEERIEVTCEKSIYLDVVDKIKQAHPYEVPVIDIYTLL